MQLVYFLLFPFNKNSNSDKIQLRGLPKGPYFLDIDISIQNLDKKEIEIDGLKIIQTSSIYDEVVMLFQFTYEIGENLSENILDLKAKVNGELRRQTLAIFNKNDDLVEEYSTLLIQKKDRLKDFVEKNKFILARFIRSVDKKISNEDAQEILTSKVAYSNEDLAIVDWEGAMVIDGDGDFESQLELLRVGNYQLLRYRILDSLIEKSLKTVRSAIEGKKKKFVGTGLIRDTIQNKLSLLLDFDKVDQSLLLVGDWYSSKLYKVIIEEFYIDDWRNLVKNKLDNLEAIDQTARENLVFGWERIVDLISVIGWAILLIGYFVLYFKDAGVY